MQVQQAQGTLHATVATAPSGVASRTESSAPMAPNPEGGQPGEKAALSATGRLLAAGAVGSVTSRRSTSVVIETRDGDRITLEITAMRRLDAAMATATDGDNAVAGAALRRGASLSIAFRVEGELNEKERKALTHVLHRVEKAAKEFYEGDLEEALEKLGEMKIDPKALSSVSVDFRRSVAIRYAEVQRMGVLPAVQDKASSGTPPGAASAAAGVASSRPAGGKPATTQPIPTAVRPDASGPPAPTATAISAAPTGAKPPAPAHPVSRLAADVRAGISLAADSGLFHSPEKGIRDLFRSMLELVSGLRDAQERGKDASGGLPKVLNALLETLTEPAGQASTVPEEEAAENGGEDATPATRPPMEGRGSGVTDDAAHPSERESDERA